MTNKTPSRDDVLKQFKEMFPNVEICPNWEKIECQKCHLTVTQLYILVMRVSSLENIYMVSKKNGPIMNPSNPKYFNERVLSWSRGNHNILVYIK